jgi:hypothetical protein
MRSSGLQSVFQTIRARQYFRHFPFPIKRRQPGCLQFLDHAQHARSGFPCLPANKSAQAQHVILFFCRLEPSSSAWGLSLGQIRTRQLSACLFPDKWQRASSAEGDAAAGHGEELLEDARAVVADARVRILVRHPLSYATDMLRRLL